MSHTQWGGIYMAGTLLSALLLPITGKWIDQVSLPRYTFMVVVSLALAAWFITQVHSVWWLIAGIFLLRQSGQGLMSHVAYTAMGRYFDAQRGKATAIVSMGFAFGEAVLPMAAVAAIAAVGWRYSYMGVAVFVLVLVLPLSMWLLRGHHARHQDYEHQLKQREDTGFAAVSSSHTNAVSWRRRDVLKDYRFYLLVPGVSATSLVGTAMFFSSLKFSR